MHIEPMYHRNSEDDEEESLEIACDTYETEPLFMKWEKYEIVYEVFEKLTYREQEIIASHLGFCPECFSNWMICADEKCRRIPMKTFIDIAADHMLSSPGSAERIYKEALAKLREALKTTLTSKYKNTRPTCLCRPRMGG